MYIKTVTRTRTLVVKRQRQTGTCELRFHVVSLNFPNLELRNLTKLGIFLRPSIMTRRLRRKMMLWTNLKLLRPISSAITLRTTGHSGFYRRRTHCGRYARGSFVRWVMSAFTEHGRRQSCTPSSSLSSVIGEIVVELIATPLYRRDFYEKHGLMRGSWFVIAESVFGPTLVVEFVIKIIADGFLFTPNAYVWGIRTRLLHHGWDRRQCRDGSDLRRRSQPAHKVVEDSTGSQVNHAD